MASTISCVYLRVRDLDASVRFYNQLLQKDVEKRYENRWAQYRITEEFRLGLLNLSHDRELIEGGRDINGHFNDAYIRSMPRDVEMGNGAVLNLWTENLREEYERIRKMNPVYLSDIMYVNFMFPYRHFMVKDPDGMLIEIADA